MKILKAAVSNFGSYESLTFDFNDKGLCLISGPTGSGKSTLCDVVPWILFGKTAKGGNVDEVCKWDSEASTEGVCYINMSDKHVRIIRKRARINSDLFWRINDSGECRGKDITDTQRLINELLGLDFEAFLSGSYFHEFSQAASFFIAPAKTRRETVDQVVDMSLANKLIEANKSYKKEVADSLDETEKQLLVLKTNLSHFEYSLARQQKSFQDWESTFTTRLNEARSKYDTFENDKAETIQSLVESFTEKKRRLEFEMSQIQNEIVSPELFKTKKTELQQQIDELDFKICQSCGAPLNAVKIMVLKSDLNTIEKTETQNERLQIHATTLQQRIDQLTANHRDALNKEETSQNPYAELIKSIEQETNPHQGSIESYKKQLLQTGTSLKDIDGLVKSLKREQADVKVLSTAIDLFRAQLVKTVVSLLEHDTNKKLTEYFDAEIRACFTIEGSDKIDVTIYKDGNECSYTQLSKGQRQLLRLCFGTSIMDAVANAHHTRFSTIFLDEAFDGLDEVLKVKAFQLLQELSTKHDSVFVVEHSSELKNMFTTQLHVTLSNGVSTIEEK